jgi:hypothetical protein
VTRTPGGSVSLVRPWAGPSGRGPLGKNRIVTVGIERRLTTQQPPFPFGWLWPESGLLGTSLQGQGSDPYIQGGLWFPLVSEMPHTVVSPNVSHSPKRDTFGRGSTQFSVFPAVNIGR